MMVDTIQVSEKQPAPQIAREMVTIDGEQVEVVRGNHEYVTGLIPDGKSITADLKADGVVIATLGPWPTESLPGKAALAQLRLRVTDDADPDALTPEEPIE